METLCRRPVCAFSLFFKIASFIGSGINGNLFAYVADNCFNKRFEIASFIGGGINGNWFVGIFKKYC